MVGAHPENSTGLKRTLACIGWFVLTFLCIRFQCTFSIPIAPRWILAGAFGIPTLVYWYLGWRGTLIVVLAGLAAQGDGSYSWPETIAGTVCMFAGGLVAFLIPRVDKNIRCPVNNPKDLLFQIFGQTILAFFRGLSTFIVALYFSSEYAHRLGLLSFGITSLALVLLVPFFATARVTGMPKWAGWPMVLEGVIGFFGLISATIILFASGTPLIQTLPIPYVSILLVFGTWVAIRFDLVGASLFAIITILTLLAISLIMNRSPLFLGDMYWVYHILYLFMITGVVFAYLFIASSAKASKQRDQFLQQSNLALQTQAKRLKELNEQFQLQSLKLADQAEELLNQRDQLEKSNLEMESQRQWLDSLLTHMPVGVYVIDAEEKVLKRTHQELQIKGLDNYLPLLDPSQLEQSIDVSTAEGAPIKYEDWPIVRALRYGETSQGTILRVKTVDGDTLISLNASPVRNQIGEIVGAVAVSLDITERELANQAIVESEERLRFALNAAGMMAWDHIPGSNEVRRTESMRQWLGLPPAENDLTTDEFRELIHPDDRREVIKQMDSLFELGHVNLEYRLRHSENHWLHIHSIGKVVRNNRGEVLRYVGTHRNITNEKLTNDRLLLLESAVVHAYDAVIVLDGIPTPGQGRLVLYVNDAFTRIMGYTREEILGRSLHGLRGPQTDANTLELLRLSLDQGKPFRAELLNYRKDQTPVWVDLAVEPVIINGVIRHWVMIQRDISERKQTQAALSESEAKFRGIFENAWAGVSITNSLGEFVSCNPAYLELVGRTQEELLGRTAEWISHPDDWAKQEKLRLDLYAGKIDRYQCRKRYFRPNGEAIWTDLWLNAIRNESGELQYSLGVSVDVTQQLKLEEQLRQAQKMEAFGQLAGGIAHDFNNILTAILGNLARIQLPDSDQNRALISVAEQAGARAADLTRKLLGYARRTHMLLATVKVQDVVQEVIAILRRTIDPRIVIQTNLQPCPTVMADATLLNQVLFNLCLNSRDAMPQGGVLKISTQSVVFDETSLVTNPEARVGSFTQISVSDTGVGITEAVQPHIFEPFFTTKGVGQGTGLGLSMVQGIIQQHSGWITCESSPSIGTRFDIYLPATMPELKDTSVRHPQQLDTRTPISQGSIYRPAQLGKVNAKILLVDDEPMIRALAQAVLSGQGFTVVEAEDGMEAVETYQNNEAQFDLVIMDLTMPRMSGRDAFKHLQGINPQVLVLFSSGYSAEDISDLQGAVGMLSKPYRPDTLLAAVRKALNENTIGVTTA